MFNAEKFGEPAKGGIARLRASAPAIDSCVTISKRFLCYFLSWKESKENSKMDSRLKHSGMTPPKADKCYLLIVSYFININFFISDFSFC